MDGGLGWFSVLALKMGGDVATISRGGAAPSQLQALQAWGKTRELSDSEARSYFLAKVVY